MRTVVRWVVVAITLLHGLIHLLGAAKGFDWADIDTLSEPIGTVGAIGWLAGAVLLVATSLLLARRVRWWWVVGALAVVVSQTMIVTAWSDAAAGTVANVILAAAVAYGAASEGPWGLRREYRRRVAAALDGPPSVAVLTEADLSGLPALVADHIRRSGSVGRPQVHSFEARIHGRIRRGADAPWMTFTGAQVNTYDPALRRLFSMDATMSGLPVDVLHVFEDGRATMRVRACSLVTMVDASGPDMKRAETVTLFNDLCILAPAALVDAPVEWQPIDDHRVRGTFTHAEQSVSAELVFDDDHDLIDFVSDDRLRSMSEGDEFVRQRWSTPVSHYRDFDGRRIATVGAGRWHAPDPEGEFAYLEFVVGAIAYNVERSR